MSGKAHTGLKRPRKDGPPEQMVALFPPIHVSHASVAGPGPRAPPRNKMALYESISIPSKRHASGPQPTQSGSSQFLGSTSGSQSSQPAVVDTVSTLRPAPNRYGSVVQACSCPSPCLAIGLRAASWDSRQLVMTQPFPLPFCTPVEVVFHSLKCPASLCLLLPSDLSG